MDSEAMPWDSYAVIWATENSIHPYKTHHLKRWAYHTGYHRGSILGPLLFLLYINDLQNSITNSDLRLFADDTTVFLHGDDPPTVTADANNEMKNIVQWYNANKLKLSINKSNFILFQKEKP